MENIEITQAVRERYGKVAREGRAGCGCGPAPAKNKSCCGAAPSAKEVSRRIGYTESEVEAAPEGANLGLGCGNPLAIAALKEGETVLDLGSGGGFDCFLAARQVGKSGRIIGVDMTPDMIDLARRNAGRGGYENVEFRLGEIENLPVSDCSVDVIISNCVINLSQNKPRVFAEAFRVLKPGGRIQVSDMVLLATLPEDVRESIEAYASCVAGASLKSDYLEKIHEAGFKEVTVTSETHMPLDLITSDPDVRELVGKLDKSPTELLDIADAVVSIKVSAVKPAA
jgi:arsenite methyltransferase